MRLSVEFFRDPESPETVTRAKKAAVLYDIVIIEAGLYELTRGPVSALWPDR